MLRFISTSRLEHQHAKDYHSRSPQPQAAQYLPPYHTIAGVFLRRCLGRPLDPMAYPV